MKDRGSPGLELDDLDSDLGETRNVAAEDPTVVEKLLGLARSFRWPEQLFDPGIGLPVAPGTAKKAKQKAAK